LFEHIGRTKLEGVKVMQKLFSYLFLAACKIALTIAVMIKGWGLHPQSWWWIIGGGVFGVTFLHMITDAIEKEGKNANRK
jgi:hypothetical protein